MLLACLLVFSIMPIIFASPAVASTPPCTSSSSETVNPDGSYYVVNTQFCAVSSGSVTPLMSYPCVATTQGVQPACGGGDTYQTYCATVGIDFYTFYGLEYMYYGISACHISDITAGYISYYPSAPTYQFSTVWPTIWSLNTVTQSVLPVPPSKPLEVQFYSQATTIYNEPVTGGWTPGPTISCIIYAFVTSYDTGCTA